VGTLKKRPSFYKIVDYLSKMHEAIPQNEKSQITVDLTELTINVKPRSRSRVLLTDEEESVNIKKVKNDVPTKESSSKSSSNNN